MTNPTTTTTTNEHLAPKAHRYMVAVVVAAEELPMPTRITFQGDGVGESGASIMCLSFRTVADGQAWGRHLGGRTDAYVSAETGETWLDHGVIRWHGWSVILDARDKPAEEDQQDTGSKPSTEGPCWNRFCIASFCDGVNHVDATGYDWVERRPERGER
jgi:hypothetical protein